jgi:predicted MarR family transcription regulator
LPAIGRRPSSSSFAWRFLFYGRVARSCVRNLRNHWARTGSKPDLLARLFDDQPEREHVRYHLLAYALKKLVRSGLIARRKVAGNRVLYRLT